MKVLFVHNRYRERGGEDFVVDREIALLQAAGHEVRLLEKDSRELEAAGKLAQLRAAWELPYSPSGREAVAREIDSFRPELVHVHNFFPAFTPAVYDAIRGAHLPVVQTLHNYRVFCASALLARDGKPCELCLTGSTAPARKFRCYQGSRLKTAALTRMISRHRREGTWSTKVDRFIALSDFSRGKFVEGGLKAEKIRVKPNFCFPPAGEPAAGREGFALFVGRLSGEKGVHTLLEAWRGLKIPLQIAGDGPLRASAAAAGAAQAHLLGSQSSENISRLMRRASFLVLPSVCYENFPLVVAEAFAHGLPVIASRLGSLGEIIRHEENGLHFAAGDITALRQAVERLASDPGLRERLGAQAREDYLRLYTPERNLEQLLEIYREASSC
jgi:glycosyltransferase involved in cell wall biosynthesis